MCFPYLYLSTIVMSLWVVSSDRQECSSWEPLQNNEKWQDEICYLPENESLRITDSFSCSNQKDPVSWKILDIPGSLEVEFPFIPYGGTVDSYKVTLQVDENAKTPKECLGSLNFFPGVHSIKYYGIVRCDLRMGDDCNQPCGKTGKILFRYVFSGCYRLGVEVYNEADEEQGSQSISCPEFVATTYNMSLLWNLVPKISLAPRPQSENLEIAITLVVAHQLSLKLSSLAQGLHCHQSGTEHSCCQYVPNKDVKCRSSGYLTPICSRVPNQNTVTCTFHNVTVGHYCLSVKIIDDERCERNTIWTTDDNKPCKWTHNFPVTEERYNETITVIPPQPDTLTEVYVICAAVVATLIILLIIVVATYLWYARHVRKRLSGRSQRHHLSYLEQRLFPSPQNPTDKTKILLLYAGDCSLFMKLMASFRLVLQHVANCEVLDCFDPALAEEVSDSPVEWVRRQVTSPDVKVVVVATECAAVRQKAHVNGAMTAYKSPTCFDDLFLYGLKTITDHIDDGYNKCYVVRFDGFTDDTNLLSYLTPQRRFVLPMHLGDLASYINQGKSFEPDKKLESRWEVQLSESLTNLVNYKMQNGDYLRELIMIP